MDPAEGPSSNSLRCPRELCKKLFLTETQLQRHLNLHKNLDATLLERRYQRFKKENVKTSAIENHAITAQNDLFTTPSASDIDQQAVRPSSRILTPRRNLSNALVAAATKESSEITSILQHSQYYNGLDAQQKIQLKKVLNEVLKELKVFHDLPKVNKVFVLDNPERQEVLTNLNIYVSHDGEIEKYLICDDCNVKFNSSDTKAKHNCYKDSSKKFHLTCPNGKCWKATFHSETHIAQHLNFHKKTEEAPIILSERYKKLRREKNKVKSLSVMSPAIENNDITTQNDLFTPPSASDINQQKRDREPDFTPPVKDHQ